MCEKHMGGICVKCGRRILAWCLMLGLLFTLAPYAPARAENADWAAEADASWYTVGGQEYRISTPQALAGLAQLVNGGTNFKDKTVTLEANLDLSGKTWTPIGTDGKAFCGIFVGDGHRVKGMDVRLTQAEEPLYAGLFGQTETGEIKDLMVQGTCSVLNAKNYLYVGGIVGKVGTNAKLKNCSADVAVAISLKEKKVNQYAGGLAGYCSNGTILNCFSTGTVAAEDARNVGGLLGKKDGAVGNCHFLADSCERGIGAGEGTAASFTAETVEGLLESLNTWAEENHYLAWVAGEPYPRFETAAEPALCRVAFDAAGGGPQPEVQQVQPGGVLQKPGDPVYGGREFLGWFAPGAETAWNFAWDTVTGDMTLTARWRVPEKTVLEIDCTPQEAEYGASPSFQVKSEAAEGFTVRYLREDEEVTPRDAGSYDVRVTRPEDGTYAAVDRTIPGGLAVRPRVAELRWTGGGTRVYSGQPSEIRAEVQNLLPEDQCGVTVTGGGETDAGLHTARAEALSNGNYALPQESTKAYTILPAKVTPALENNRLYYNGQEQAAQLQIHVEGGLELRRESYTLEYLQEGQPAVPKAPGTYQVVFTLTDRNFAFSQEGEGDSRLLGNLEITAENYPFEIRWPTGLELTYGDKLSQCALENELEKNGTFVWKEPGHVPQAGDRRFPAVFYPTDSAYPPVEGELEATVRPRDVTLSLRGEKRYGEEPVDLSQGEIDVQGMLPGETELSLLGELRFSCVGNSREADVGKYGITVAQTAPTNYRVVTGELEYAFEVKPAVHTLEGECVYEKTAGAPPFTLDLKSSAGASVSYGLIEGDAVTVTPEGTVTVVKPGTAKISARAEKNNYETAQAAVKVHVGKDTRLRLLPPADIGPTGAVLRGWVEAGGALTAVLEYRKQGAQSWLPGLTVQVGAEERRDLSCALTGLEPDTCYEARLRASGRDLALSFRTAQAGVGGRIPGTVTGTVGETWVTVTAGGVVLACVPAAGGNFTLPGLPDGVYQLTAEDEAHRCAEVLHVVDGQVQGLAQLALDRGDSRVEVNGECLRAVGGLSAFADAVKSCLSFQAAPAGSELSLETRKKVLPLAGEQELGPVLEFRLFWDTGEELTELARPLTLWLPLTGEMQSASAFQVYRVHNGVAERVGELLGESVRRVGGLLEVKVCRFSACVVGYTPEKKQEPEGPGGGNFGGGGTEKPQEPEHLCKKYTDIAGHWAGEAICTVTELGLFSGLTETSFGPQAAMSRAMAVTVLWRLAGKPAGAGERFADVDPESWYAQAAAWAREKNILQGVGQNRFDPHRTVTRQELAVLLFRYAGKRVEGKDYLLLQFEDGETAASWAQDGVLWAVDRGLLRGNGGRLEPERAVTRAEVAQILARYLENE